MLERTLLVISGSPQVELGYTPGFSHHVCLFMGRHSQWQTVKGGLCRVTCLHSGEGGHPRKSPFPSTFLYRWAARVKPWWVFPRKQWCWKANQEGGRISEPFRASAFWELTYTKLHREFWFCSCHFTLTPKYFARSLPLFADTHSDRLVSRDFFTLCMEIVSQFFL